MCKLQSETGKFVHTLFYALFTELDLALSFLKTGRVMPSQDKQFYESHAVKIYKEVSEKVSRMFMPPDTREELNKKLLAVSTQLLAAGYTVDSAMKQSAS